MLEPPDPKITQLETLLSRIKQLSSLSVSLDGYERWGNGSDPEFEAQAAAELAELSRVRGELEATTIAMLASHPDVLADWARRHIALLEHYLNEMVADDSTEAFVAKGEMEKWKQVEEGKLPFVRENPVYVKPDGATYERLFGLRLPGLHW